MESLLLHKVDIIGFIALLASTAFFVWSFADLLGYGKSFDQYMKERYGESYNEIIDLN